MELSYRHNMVKNIIYTLVGFDSSRNQKILAVPLPYVKEERGIRYLKIVVCSTVTSQRKTYK